MMSSSSASSNAAILRRPPQLVPIRSSSSTAFILKPSFINHTRLSQSLSLSSSSSCISLRSVRMKKKIKCGVVKEIKESEFGKVVLKSERPVLVEFIAGWCGPCRLIAPAIESVAKEYEDKLLVVKIDHDANPKLIEEYKVYGLPALILFKDGKEIPESRREGAITKAKLKVYIDTLLESVSVS